jgi:isocitrate dehydrogenase
MEYEPRDVPDDGQQIHVVDEEDDCIEVPDRPIVPVVYGDGVGEEVVSAAQRVLEAAANGTGRDIAWMRVYAGESARERYGESLPAETLDAFEEFRVGLKGPLAPVEGRERSLNAEFRGELNLYSNVRPTYYLRGIRSPVSNPEAMDIVTFRESTEDVFAGIEWDAGTPESDAISRFVREELSADDRMPAGPLGIGLKPISEASTKRLVRKAIDYALDGDRESVTLVHKGTKMESTEGAFRDWGYEVVDEYGDEVVPEASLDRRPGDATPDGTVVVRDALVDTVLQRVQTQPSTYDVLAAPNQNGDYVADACSAQIGGPGIAPAANVGDARCVAESVHGSVPMQAGLNKVNPTAMILSGRIVFEYLGWEDAARVVRAALEETISLGTMTYDMAYNRDDAYEVTTSEFVDTVVENIERLA